MVNLAIAYCRFKLSDLNAALRTNMTMDEEELSPPPILSLTKAEIEDLSVAELEARIAALEAEIERVRDVMAKKQDSKSAAEAVFGKS